MTTTAHDVIRIALRFVGLETRLRKASPQDYNDMLGVLNRMLLTWYKLGLRAAYNTDTLTLTTPMPYPDDAITAITYSLAKEGHDWIAIETPLGVNIYDQEKTHKNSLWILYGETPKSVYPGTLPIGSGNEYDNFGYNSSFYPDCDEPIYGNCVDNQLATDSDVILTGVDNE